MCIFSVIYRVVPECPIFVLTNRDESTEAPVCSAAGVHVRYGRPALVRSGGRPGGGTWFGINEHGLLAAVTNRKKNQLPANPRSRRLLSAMFLHRRRRRPPSSG